MEEWDGAPGRCVLQGCLQLAVSVCAFCSPRCESFCLSLFVLLCNRVMLVVLVGWGVARQGEAVAG